MKEAKNFDAPLVKHQVSYLGLLENVRVRRAGFAYKQEYKEALGRYGLYNVMHFNDHCTYTYYHDTTIPLATPGTKCCAKRLGLIGREVPERESEKFSK